MKKYRAYYTGSKSSVGMSYEGTVYTFNRLEPKEVPEKLALYLERLDYFDITESE